MSFAVIISLALAIGGPVQDNGDKDKGKEEGKPCAEDAWILPYPPQVPKPPPAVVEDDPDLQALVDDLDCYRMHYYRNDFVLRPGSRMRDVRRELGAPDDRTQPPDSAGNVVWWYGESFVLFHDRRVVAWKENDTPLEFGLEVAPRHYLPRTAFIDIAPEPTVRSVLGVGGPGPNPNNPTTPGAAVGISALDQARVAYNQALGKLSSMPNDVSLVEAARQAGLTYYGLTHTDGRATRLDEQQIEQDIAGATRSGR